MQEGDRAAAALREAKEQRGKAMQEVQDLKAVLQSLEVSCHILRLNPHLTAVFTLDEAMLQPFLGKRHPQPSMCIS